MTAPLLATESSAGTQPVRRRLALAGIGSTGGPGISTRIDELLADGFGRDEVVLIVDTGPLVAIADEGDKNYRACPDLLTTASGPLITTELIIAEAGNLLNRDLETGPNSHSSR